MPTSIGFQDIGALLGHRPVESRAWRGHLIASPFGTIEPSTYAYARPIGTAMPRPPGYQLVNFDAASVEANAFGIGAPLRASGARRIAYPSVDRRHKGDRLPSNSAAPASVQPTSLPQLQPINVGPAVQPAPRPVLPPLPPANAHRPTQSQASPAAPAVARPVVIPGAEAQAAVRSRATDIAASQQQDSAARSRNPTVVGAFAHVARQVPPAGDLDASDGREPPPFASAAFADDSADGRGGEVYFDSAAVGSAGGLEPWAPGAEPVTAAASAESGIKLADLGGAESDATAGESVAGKDDPSRMLSPAQRLGLAGKERDKAVRCLSDAIYFEARSEPRKGQEAIAQVVINRVFSGYYPRNVCGVVFQNASHYLGCQFTFACEHRNLNRIDEPVMWAQAKHIANAALDGKIWLADIGHATHYHADWVHPYWVREMTKLHKLGAHTFYRPRAWGSGDDEPVWGSMPATSKADSDAAKPQA